MIFVVLCAIAVVHFYVAYAVILYVFAERVLTRETRSALTGAAGAVARSALGSAGAAADGEQICVRKS